MASPNNTKWTSGYLQLLKLPSRQRLGELAMELCDEHSGRGLLTLGEEVHLLKP